MLDQAEIAAISLDPDDWVAYRHQLHELVDQCIDHLQEIRSRPWQAPDNATIERVKLGLADSGVGLEQTMEELATSILPYGSGNTHPTFFGWVQGTGNVAALAAEVVTAAMNSNCGGRNHGAVYIERDVINWCRDVFGFPATSSGVLVTGTSQATVIALAVARQAALGDECRQTGVYSSPRLVMYASDQAHSSIAKAAELLGIGRNGVRMIRSMAESGAMDLEMLEAAIARDRASGLLPFCVVGTAGSVDIGSFDDLQALAAICRDGQLWFHVDGAFGAWLRIADAPWSRLVAGIDLADSIACDFHKWMYVQYDCALALIRDESLHRAAFAERPAYLTAHTRGVGGGDPWYCDYGVDLSRAFRANKVWATLRAFGASTLGRAITRNCELARFMASRVAATELLELCAPVHSNVCCFRISPSVTGVADAADKVNTDCVVALQMSGTAVFSTTKVNGATVIRAAITNHRTNRDDIVNVVDQVIAFALDRT